MKSLKILLFSLLIVSCASIRVNYDYDKTTVFDNYKTYNYYSDLQTGMNEFDTKRLLAAIDTNLQSKGFSLSETPDFFINIQSSEYQNTQRNTVGLGVGGGGRNVGGGLSLGIPIGQSNINRQIMIDFIDENGKGLFWQAVSESSFNPNASPEKREASLKAVVDKVLLQYPPKQ
ncbi:MAG: DUF4136 domain-containing protein [Flavobacteriaceae bacterium]|nr:DUF4136 domain-containing protein [Flavobacteriaceae bacterium]